MSTQELDRAKEMWARAEWEPDEAKKKSLAHQIITAFDELLAADNDELSKIERAAVHNLRGLAYAMLGGAEHLELARHDYKRALKLNGSMGQASKNLQAVNAALHARDVAAKNAKIRQRRLKYCCGCVPRCKKGPWKPKVKTEDFGGPAFAKVQQKTHLLTNLPLKSVVVGDTNGPSTTAPTEPPQISFAWPDGGASARESKKKAPDRDVLLAIESCKLAA